MLVTGVTRLWPGIRVSQLFVILRVRIGAFRIKRPLITYRQNTLFVVTSQGNHYFYTESLYAGMTNRTEKIRRIRYVMCTGGGKSHRSCYPMILGLCLYCVRAVQLLPKYAVQTRG